MPLRSNPVAQWTEPPDSGAVVRIQLVYPALEVASGTWGISSTPGEAAFAHAGGGVLGISSDGAARVDLYTRDEVVSLREDPLPDPPGP